MHVKTPRRAKSPTPRRAKSPGVKTPLRESPTPRRATPGVKSPRPPPTIGEKWRRAKIADADAVRSALRDLVVLLAIQDYDERTVAFQRAGYSMGEMEYDDDDLIGTEFHKHIKVALGSVKIGVYGKNNVPYEFDRDPLPGHGIVEIGVHRENERHADVLLNFYFDLRTLACKSPNIATLRARSAETLVRLAFAKTVVYPVIFAAFAVSAADQAWIAEQWEWWVRANRLANVASNREDLESARAVLLELAGDGVLDIALPDNFRRRP